MSRPIGALVAVILLFLLGVLVGVLGTHAYYANRIQRPGGLYGIGLSLLEKSLDTRLDLSEEQEDAIHEILAESEVLANSLRAEIEPQVVEHLEDTANRILEILDEEQAEEFRKLVGERWSRTKQQLTDPPPEAVPPAEEP